jgi:ATP-GRASP peptide maturase of grasp-with-spasm system
MILILSNPLLQPSIDEVINWLRHYGIPFIRVNGLNVDEVQELFFQLGSVHQQELKIDGQRIIPAEIKAVWYYRWVHPKNYGDICINEEIGRAQGNVANRIAHEADTVAGYFFHLFAHAHWLSDNNAGILNKLITLQQAKDVGLDIPQTAVATTKTQVRQFMQQHPEVITKPVYELFHFEYEEHTYSSFTAILDDRIEELSEQISPTLLQEKIDKEVEIRTFYLDGEIYSMAIFSQKDKQTAVDFRIYNYDTPNRNVPYRLPHDIEEKLRQLMRKKGLNTGSIDFIKSTTGRFVFLEINPVGQFGMTSRPCNYFLEQRIAQHLIHHGQ